MEQTVQFWIFIVDDRLKAAIPLTKPSDVFMVKVVHTLATFCKDFLI